MTEVEHLPLALIILDGWGIAPAWGGNAIALAKTPTMNTLWSTMPHTQLDAAAEAVGLPHGVMGNSEVGHLNIGAGKVVKQFLPLIDEQIKQRTFFANPTLTREMEQVKKDKKTLHLAGILSDGSVHGHINHLFALIELAKVMEMPDVVIHAFTDGRDTEPSAAPLYINKLTKYIKAIHSNARVGSISGRFYAMDRDNRWERTAKTYNAMVYGTGKEFPDMTSAVTEAYNNSMYDEFIEPCVIRDKDHGISTVKDGDGVIFFNFRADRMRQIVKAFCGKDADMDRGKNPPKVSIVTFTEYQAGLPVEVAFHPDKVDLSLADIVSQSGLRQFHVAETEKYAHVTYFFNGGVEAPEALETRLLIPSPKVVTYDQAPEMSAKPIADAVIEKMSKKGADVFVVNFANADMVGHTGNIQATIDAVQTIDTCLGRIWDAISKNNGTMIITADHGNAEEMVNPSTGLPDTEHTKNPVPLIIASKDPAISGLHLRATGCLGNIAPTIIDILKLQKPATMVLESLIEK